LRGGDVMQASIPQISRHTEMILIVDNYDSFTYNLVQRLGEIDSSLDIQVHRNDQISVEEIRARRPSHLIISPGPCTPNEAGISVDCVRQLAGKLPILGVCLGHQSIGQATGATIVRARELMHGKTDSIHHDDRGLFAGMPNPFVATRYHSLVIEPGTLSDDFEVSAWASTRSGEREIMGIRHKRFPLEGLQFHPESFLTECGHELLKRFLQQASSQ
jgi:anthranilate synthase/aminodeoxychorismate synthase-like glutamine amidotransferase